jgi:hypothetical protein
MKILILIPIITVFILLGLGLWRELLQEKIERLLREEIDYLKDKLSEYEHKNT